MSRDFEAQNPGHWETYGGQKVVVGEHVTDDTELLIAAGGLQSAWRGVRELAFERHPRGEVTATIGKPGEEPLLQVGRFEPPLVYKGHEVGAIMFTPNELIFPDRQETEQR